MGTEDKQRQFENVVEWWNAHATEIETNIKESDREQEHFYWSQLVWQEITMFIQIGQPVDQEEFSWLCDRRGFNRLQREYLAAMVKLVDLTTVELQ